MEENKAGSITQHDIEGQQGQNDLETDAGPATQHDIDGQQEPLHDPAGGNRSRYFNELLPLREAAMKGDWPTAMKLIESYPGLCTEVITETRETLLHVAAGAGKTYFIKKLLKLLDLKKIDNKVLEQPDGKGNTAFCYAVAAGATTIAEMILRRNPKLLTIHGYNNATPLYYAALFGHGEMAIFLYNEMKHQDIKLQCEEKENIFFACLNARLYDVALKLLDDNPVLVKARTVKKDHTEGDTALHFLARDPSAFHSTIGAGIRTMKRIKSAKADGFQLAKCLWNKMKLDTNVKEMIRTPKHLLFEAVDMGNFPLIKMMIHSYPDLAWEQNDQHQTIFHAAIKQRRADIFYLIYDVGSIKNVITTYVDNEENNMLHLVAIPPDKSRLDLIPGAALQMQQELLWYKEVKKIMEPGPFERINRNNKTPEVLFMIEHEKLREDGEKWMKIAAKSCTIVATLIATVVFATAFTMPGGSDQNKGTAVFFNDEASKITFLKQHPFIFSIFSISSGVALATSITSILIFLTILISPYSQKEFLNSLPLKLVMGFITLLISMIGMIFAFSDAFMLAYSSKKSKLIPWVIIAINIVPIFLFLVSLGPLFCKVFCSTHIFKYLCGQRKLRLY